MGRIDNAGRNGANTAGGNGSVGDSDNVILPPQHVEANRRQSSPKSDSLLQLVLEHVKDFKHTPGEVQALDRFDASSHTGDFGEVYSWLTINLQVHGQPVVEFVWNIKQRYQRKGYRLLGFRSTSGFGSTRYTHNHAVYGDLIFSVDLGAGRATPTAKNFVQEGTYFYTFLVLKTGFFGLWHRYAGPIQITASVPNLAWAKAQAETHHAYKDTVRREEYDSLNHDIKMKTTNAQLDRIAGEKRPRADTEQQQIIDELMREADMESLYDGVLELRLKILRESSAYVNASPAERIILEKRVKLSVAKSRDGRLKP